MLEVYGLMIFVVIGLSSLWVKGITNMHENHPDYKGNGEGFDFDDENRKDYDEE
jgi:hypothetical protein